MSADLTTPSEAAGRTTNNRIALGYILIAVVSYALIPAVIEFIGGEKLPFFFVASWRLGVAVGCICILAVFYVPLWFNRYNWGRFKYYLSTSDTRLSTGISRYQPPHSRRRASEPWSTEESRATS